MKIPFFLLLALILVNLPFSQSKYQNIMISNENEPNEPTIAINPIDPNNIVAAANIDNYFYSLDGGLTWSVRRSVSDDGVWGHPCIISDHRGNFYYFHLSNSYTNGGAWLDRMICQKSIDGGITWSGGTFTGENKPHLQDKEWAAVDNTFSRFRNNIYLAWTQCGQQKFNDEGASFSGDSASNIIFSFSRDGGESWSERMRINKVSGTECTYAESTVLGAMPCVGTNGEVYIAWCSPGGTILDRST